MDNFDVELREAEFAPLTTSEHLEKIKRLLKSYNSKYSGKELVEKVKDLIHHVILRGEKGQEGYLETFPGSRTCNICVKYNIDLTLDEQRSWISTMSKIFKPLMLRDYEFSPNKNFEQIVKKPYIEKQIIAEIPTPHGIIKKPTYSRKKTYATKAPYAGKSNLPEDMQKRNTWIKKTYRELYQKYPREKYLANYYKIRNMLKNESFGKARIKLSIES